MMAKGSGLSKLTVSRIVNGEEGVTEKTLMALNNGIAQLTEKAKQDKQELENILTAINKKVKK